MHWAQEVASWSGATTAGGQRHLRPETFSWVGLQDELILRILTHCANARCRLTNEADATALTLALLSILRAAEDRPPSQSFVHCHLSFRRDQLGDEHWLRTLVAEHGFSITDLSYRLDSRTESFEYKFVMWSADPRACGNFT